MLLKTLPAVVLQDLAPFTCLYLSQSSKFKSDFRVQICASSYFILVVAAAIFAGKKKSYRKILFLDFLCYKNTVHKMAAHLPVQAYYIGLLFWLKDMLTAYIQAINL